MVRLFWICSHDGECWLSVFEQTPVDSTKFLLFIKSEAVSRWLPMVCCNVSRETRKPFSFVDQLKRMVHECDQVAHPLVLVPQFNSVVHKLDSSTCYGVLSSRVTSIFVEGWVSCSGTIEPFKKKLWNLSKHVLLGTHYSEVVLTNCLVFFPLSLHLLDMFAT